MRSTPKLLPVLACLWLAVGSASGEEPWHVQTEAQLLAVSDIHGAFDAFVDILQESGVIDAQRRWAGGGTRLVVVGDVLDRGPDSRAALDLIIQLQTEARSAGGDVLFVLGNHEIMNLVGDLRYVPLAEYASYADVEPQDTRTAAFESFFGRAPEPRDREALRAQFDERFPLGYFAHRDAFSSTGIYGTWLLEQPILLIVNRTAFVHGGLSRAYEGTTAADINRLLKQQLREYIIDMEVLFASGVLSPVDDFYDHPALIDSFAARVSAGTASWSDETAAAAERIKTLNDAPIFALASPTWYRGTVSCSPLVERDHWMAMLDELDVDRVVVGHTPTPEARVLGRLDNGILRIDTGMLASFYGGRAAALGIAGDTLGVRYAGEAALAMPLPQPRRVGGRPGSLTDDELETLLRTGAITERAQTEAGLRVTIEAGEIRAAAAFHPSARATERPEVAAYRLDRLLGLGMVPVTVARDIDGAPGALEYLPPNIITEAERMQLGSGGAAWCPLRDQYPSMYVFDTLVYNEGRDVGRIAYETESFQLVLLGHDRTFGTQRGRPAHLREATLELTTAWREALGNLDEARLTESLGDVLSRRQIRALERRIDDVLREAPAQ